MKDAKKRKIFISHSRKDWELGSTILQLLLDLGIEDDQIVFTSLPKYGIPLGYNIFQYLKEQINNDAYMIYLLSDNYYHSTACLNEMGAAWVVQNEHMILAVPEFDFNGNNFHNSAVDAREMGTVLDDAERMLQFAEAIVSGFDLNPDCIGEALDQYFVRLKETMQIRHVKLMIDLMRVEREIRDGSKLDEKYHWKGFLLYDTQRENYQAAFQNCLYALYLNPNYVEGYSRLVQMEVYQKEYQKSLTIANEMCRKFPNHALSYGSRGYAECNMGMRLEAIKDLTHAIELDPKYWWYYATRGHCYTQGSEKERDAALADFWAAYKADPNCDTAVEKIKNICREAGLYEMCMAAIEYKENALEAKRNGEKAIEKEEKEKSRLYFKSILLTDDRYEKGLQEYGGYYYDFENYEEAGKLWKSALDVHECCKNYYLYALALECCNKIKQAREFYIQALEYPDDGYLGKAKENLNRINEKLGIQ